MLALVGGLERQSNENQISCNLVHYRIFICALRLWRKQGTDGHTLQRARCNADDCTCRGDGDGHTKPSTYCYLGKYCTRDGGTSSGKHSYAHRCGSIYASWPIWL